MRVTDGIVLAVVGSTSLGFVDVFVTMTTRRLGTRWTLAGLFTGSILCLGVLTLMLGSSLAPYTASAGQLAVSGVLSAVSYFALISALKYGPLSVVGPIAASSGAVVAILAILFLSERPTYLQLLGIAAATTGAAMVAVRPGLDSKRLPRRGRGPSFAMVNVVSVAVGLLVLRELTRNGAAGTTGTLFAQRIVAASCLAIVLRSRRQLASDHPTALSRTPFVLAAVVLGAVDAGGLLLLTHALQVAPAWFVGVATTIAPTIVTVSGVTMFRERLGRIQVLGIASLLAGLLVLSFASGQVPSTP